MRRKSPGPGFLWSFLVITGFVLWFGVVAVGGATIFASRAIANYAELLPSPETLIQRESFESTKIYDRTGTILLYEIIDPRGGRRTRVSLDRIPAHLIQATLAAEDKDFYSNPGFDIRRIVSAAVQNFTSGEIVSGASTITQQLVKNVILEPEERTEQTLARKIKEAALAYQITQTFSKDQILEMYLNEIHYGNVSYGIQAASESYFGKDVSELTLGEAALLAGLPQSPSYYNPLQNLKAAKERQQYVLSRMVEDGYITDAQAKAAAEEELEFVNFSIDIKAPHFVFYVRDILEQKYGAERLYRGGFNVITTLDYGLQENAQRIVAEHVESIRRYNANNAAIVAMDPRTAEILTMVGSVDYYDQSISGQVNVATSERQPGSTLKPITFALAFQKGWTPATIIQDVPLAIPDNNQVWRPQNFDNRFRGPVTARASLAQSLNIPAIKALQYVGTDSMIRLARSMGLTSLSEDRYYGLSVTIGGAEVKLVDLVSAYTVFASGGVRREPTAILKITDSAGNVIEEYQPSEGKRVLSEEVTYLITSILSDDIARQPTYGANSPLKLSRPAAVKTGTTDDNRDSWTVGYTPELVAGVWIGNTNSEPMTGIFGVSGAGQVWHNFMEMALEGVPPSEFPKPQNIVETRVCVDTDCNRSYTEVFIRGTERQGGRFWDSAPSGDAVSATSPFSATMTAIAVERQASRTPTPTQTQAATPTAQPPTAAPSPADSAAPAPEATPTNAAVERGVVPDVIGMPEAEAKAAIQAAGLRVAPYVNYQGRDQLPEEVLQSVPIGTVLSTSPGPGTSVPPGALINIAVRRE